MNESVKPYGKWPGDLSPPVNHVRLVGPAPRYHVIMLREGAFRGVSPPKPIRFSRRVLAQYAGTMEGKPFKLNHDSAQAKVAGAPVGVVRNVRFEHDAVVGEIVLDPKAPHFELAKAFLDSTLALGGVPNVSIEGDYTAIEKAGELNVETIAFTALTGVHRGACSDIAGCGVTAALARGSDMTEETTTTTIATGTPITAGTVTFTVVPDAEPAKAAAPDGVATLAAEKTALEVKLAESDKALVAVKAALAESEKALETERAKVPVLVALAAIAPEYPTEGKTLCELKAALEMAKLGPKTETPSRKSLLAEPVPAPKTVKELLAEAMTRY